MQIKLSLLQGPGIYCAYTTKPAIATYGTSVSNALSRWGESFQLWVETMESEGKLDRVLKELELEQHSQQMD